MSGAKNAPSLIALELYRLNMFCSKKNEIGITNNSQDKKFIEPDENNSYKFVCEPFKLTTSANTPSHWNNCQGY